MRLLEKRFEQEVQQQVVSTDINDERGRRLNAGDVRKILIRPDPDVGAASNTTFVEFGEHFEVRPFVGNEIVGVEITTLLRERGDLGGKARSRCRGLEGLAQTRDGGQRYDRGHDPKDRIVGSPSNSVSHGAQLRSLTTV